MVTSCSTSIYTVVHTQLIQSLSSHMELHDFVEYCILYYSSRSNLAFSFNDLSQLITIHSIVSLPPCSYNITPLIHNSPPLIHSSPNQSSLECSRSVQLSVAKRRQASLPSNSCAGKSLSEQNEGSRRTSDRRSSCLQEEIPHRRRRIGLGNSGYTPRVHVSR